MIDVGLEKEADVMGAKASSFNSNGNVKVDNPQNTASHIIQCAWWYSNNEYSQLSQNPELGDVSQDEAYEYVLRTYSPRVVELDVPFSPQEMNEENGWVKLPLTLANKIEDAQPLREVEEAQEKTVVDGHTPIEGEEVETFDDQPLREAEEAQEETNIWLKLLAASLLPGMIAWQTYKDRQGKPTKGKGQSWVENLMIEVEMHMENANVALDKVNKLNVVRLHPFREAFIMGLDLRPMPVAKRYAQIDELWTAVDQISFLMMANESDINQLYSTLLKDEGQDSNRVEPIEVEESSGGILNDGLRTRRNLQVGYGTGLATGSFVTSQFELTSHPVSWLGGWWNSYHVVNEYAIRMRDLREIENQRARQAVMHFQRQQALIGRQVRQRSVQSIAPKALIFISRFIK